MKVIGVGLNKTGTTSLGRAIEILGYENHQSWSLEKTIDWKHNKTDELISFISNFNNVEDFPWALIYKELDEALDNTMFILTTRSTPEKWYESQCKHYLREYRQETLYINKTVYGYEDPHENKEAYISKYVNHNKEVREYFQSKSNFVEVCWENGDGWQELCSFLETETPTVDFPFLNRRPPKHFAEKVFRKLGLS